MKWKFYPTNKELTTTLPMYLELTEVQGKAKIHLSSVGKLNLAKMKDGALKAEFYVSLPGKYLLEMSDASTQYTHKFEVKQHSFLKFTEEFGFFLILFTLMMGGLIVWTRKIMKKSIKKT